MSNVVELRVDRLRSAIQLDVKDSREKSLALTKLDECEMWLARCSVAVSASDQDNIVLVDAQRRLTASEFLYKIANNARHTIERDGQGNYNIVVEEDGGKIRYFGPDIMMLSAGDQMMFLAYMNEIMR